MLYVIEGPDGVGKDSIINYLVAVYGCEKFFTNFPSYREEMFSYTYEKTRQLMRDYLSEKDNCTPYTFQLANLIDKHTHNEFVIDCKEDPNTIHLLNRWKASGFIYGSLDMTEKEGFDFEVSQYLCKNMMSLIEDPDGEICLMADPAVLIDRMGKRKGKSVYEKKDFLEKVCEMYMQFYRDRENSCIIYTNEKDIEEVGNEVYNAIMDMEKNKK